jgi:cysteinyl-tRNA synthetase
LDIFYASVKKSAKKDSTGSLCDDVAQKVTEAKAKFIAAMNDDLNTPRAIACVFDIVKSTKVSQFYNYLCVKCIFFKFFAESV